MSAGVGGPPAAAVAALTAVWAHLHAPSEAPLVYTPPDGTRFGGQGIKGIVVGARQCSRVLRKAPGKRLAGLSWVARHVQRGAWAQRLAQRQARHVAQDCGDSAQRSACGCCALRTVMGACTVAAGPMHPSVPAPLLRRTLLGWQTCTRERGLLDEQATQRMLLQEQAETDSEGRSCGPGQALRMLLQPEQADAGTGDCCTNRPRSACTCSPTPALPRSPPCCAARSARASCTRDEVGSSRPRHLCAHKGQCCIKSSRGA